MKAQILRFSRMAVAAIVLVVSLPLTAGAQPVRERYNTLHAREQQVLELIAATRPDAPARDEVIRQARRVIAGYEALVRRFHSSGYSDNALWNAATIAEALFAKFSRAADKDLAGRYIGRLAAEYPTSSLLKKAELPLSGAAKAVPSALPAPSAPSPTRATLTAIERAISPEGVRITLALDREVPYSEQRLSGPSRVFFDLKDVQTTPELRDAVLRYTSDAVRQIRVGRHPNDTVRVVLDLEGVSKYSVFTLYNPFRLVVDAESVGSTVAATSTAPLVPETPTVTSPTPLPTAIPVAPSPAVNVVASAPTPAPAAPAPEPPRSNSSGGFSLSRQLGLGITRIVIDPGHGGHDPGAQGKGLNESELTLDVALRLERLLQSDGLDVVLTRRANVYIPLEERTAIANREGADLFLSIHANASRNATARGVETYFLSFASSSDAEAVAARENSASSSGMHNLPDIIKAIALNNKLDESRDFAAMVQEAMVTRLRRSNKTLRNIGVKKAPFVVLIGAEMPSVLAEMSFLTNKQELQLLKTNAYKQRIAEALHAAVLRYRRSLKGQGQVAESK